MVNGFILTFRALYKSLIHKWHKGHNSIFIKHAFCNFEILEPWTYFFCASIIHRYQALFTNSLHPISKQVQAFGIITSTFLQKQEKLQKSRELAHLIKGELGFIINNFTNLSQEETRNQKILNTLKLKKHIFLPKHCSFCKTLAISIFARAFCFVTHQTSSIHPT